MQQVNIHDAKTRFSRLVDDAAGGQVIVIAKAGRPVAKLVPIERDPVLRKKGLLKGRLKIKAAFYQPLGDDVLAAFEGTGDR